MKSDLAIGYSLQDVKESSIMIFVGKHNGGNLNSAFSPPSSQQGAG